MSDNPDIARLGEITRVDHSTIFFNTYTPSWFHGYIRDGEVRGISLKDSSPPDCSTDPPAISHDGNQITYGTADYSSDRCQILLHDLRTGNERTLAVMERRPWPLSWSWDDTEIAYGQFSFDPSRGQAENIYAISVADGSKRDLGHLQIGKSPSELWNLLGIQWLHRSPGLVLNLLTCLPDRKTGACTSRWQTLLFSDGNSRVLATGIFAVVSPVDDEIAYILDDEVVAINSDASSRRVITRLPARESPWSRIVWSPTGDRLWFSTVIDEGGNGNSYLVDVRTGHYKRILNRTLTTITDWRR